MSRKRLDLVNKKFGRLLVLEDVGNNKSGASQFLCQCDCKNTKIINGNSLTRGLTQSCGCLYKKGPIKKVIKKTILQEQPIRKLEPISATLSKQKMIKYTGISREKLRERCYGV